MHHALEIGAPQDTLQYLRQYESVQLFVERAAVTLPTFVLAESNAASVRQICRELDGIPLAIELAAARLKALSAEQIAARLDDQLGLLRGARTALPRQQTLRATLDWSYDLLSPRERQLFHRLSIFAGGFTLDAAEAARTKTLPNAKYYWRVRACNLVVSEANLAASQCSAWSAWWSFTVNVSEDQTDKQR